MTQSGVGAATQQFFTRPIVGPHGGGCCNPTIFSTNQFVDQTGAGLPQHLQPTDFWTKWGRVLLPNHLFNRPIVGQNGGGCCYPTIFSTDRFLDHTGAGAATQPFFQPTDFWTTRGQVLLPNHFFTQPIFGSHRSGRCYPTSTDSHKMMIPRLNPHTHRPIIPKTSGISSSINDRLYHGHQLSPLVPCTTVHYVTSFFSLIWDNMTNLAANTQRSGLMIMASPSYSIHQIPQIFRPLNQFGTS